MLYKKIARPAGFEPATPGFGDQCSGRTELGTYVYDRLLYYRIHRSLVADRGPRGSGRNHTPNRPSKASSALHPVLEAPGDNFLMMKGHPVEVLCLLSRHSHFTAFFQALEAFAQVCSGG